MKSRDTAAFPLAIFCCCALFAILVSVAAPRVFAHDVITTPITWSREISVIFEKKCMGCHSPVGDPTGKAFPLTTYAESRPWAVAIREEVLARRMPPWGAVNGFGDFANELSLSPEEIELIVNWTEGGVPEGDPKAAPAKIEPYVALPLHPPDALPVDGAMQLIKPLELGAIRPEKIKDGTEFQLIAELPDGSVAPLLWLKDYKAAFRHDFILREPIKLPRGTTIRGVPAGVRLALIPASSVTLKK